MLSLSIKISNLAIYDIIYISKLVFSDWFVLCIPVCGFIETLGQPNTLEWLSTCTWSPTLEISSVSSVRTTTHHTKLLVITLASLPGSVDYR